MTFVRNSNQIPGERKVLKGECVWNTEREVKESNGGVIFDSETPSECDQG